MMRTYKMEGIILGRRNSGEADKILTLFTRQYGKKVVIAKGIRRIKSKRASHVEPFAQVLTVCHTGRTFDYITEVETIESFALARERLERIGFIYLALELTQRLTAEHQESITIFNNLLTFLHTLNQPEATRHIARQHVLKFKEDLLHELGFISERGTSEEYLDHTIRSILESQVRSELLLTNIQQHL